MTPHPQLLPTPHPNTHTRTWDLLLPPNTHHQTTLPTTGALTTLLDHLRPLDRPRAPVATRTIRLTGYGLFAPEHLHTLTTTLTAQLTAERRWPHLRFNATTSQHPGPPPPTITAHQWTHHHIRITLPTTNQPTPNQPTTTDTPTTPNPTIPGDTPTHTNQPTTNTTIPGPTIPINLDFGFNTHHHPDEPHTNDYDPLFDTDTAQPTDMTLDPLPDPHSNTDPNHHDHITDITLDPRLNPDPLFFDTYSDSALNNNPHQPTDTWWHDLINNPTHTDLDYDFNIDFNFAEPDAINTDFNFNNIDFTPHPEPDPWWDTLINNPPPPPQPTNHTTQNPPHTPH